VQSALSVPSGVLSAQVMPLVQESGPLVMRSRIPTFRRWVMSHTTCVFLVSGVSARLADPPVRSATVVSVSGGLPPPDESR
jgi:hypothetical protein